MHKSSNYGISTDLTSVVLIGGNIPTISKTYVFTLSGNTIILAAYFRIVRRFKSRGKTSWSQIYHRIICWLYQEYCFERWKSRLRFVTYQSSYCDETWKRQRGLFESVSNIYSPETFRCEVRKIVEKDFTPQVLNNIPIFLRKKPYPFTCLQLAFWNGLERITSKNIRLERININEFIVALSRRSRAKPMLLYAYKKYGTYVFYIFLMVIYEHVLFLRLPRWEKLITFTPRKPDMWRTSLIITLSKIQWRGINLERTPSQKSGSQTSEVVRLFSKHLRDLLISSAPLILFSIIFSRHIIMAIVFHVFNLFRRCNAETNLCFFGSKCINHYSESSCDCFGTPYEGELCDIYSK